MDDWVKRYEAIKQERDSWRAVALTSIFGMIFIGVIITLFGG